MKLFILTVITSNVASCPVSTQDVPIFRDTMDCSQVHCLKNRDKEIIKAGPILNLQTFLRDFCGSGWNIIEFHGGIALFYHWKQIISNFPGKGTPPPQPQTNRQIVSLLTTLIVTTCHRVLKSHFEIAYRTICSDSLLNS